MTRIALFVHSTVVSVTVYAGGEYAPWRTTGHALRTDVALWRRMHLADWNRVRARLRAEGFDALLDRFRLVVTNPRLWNRMSGAAAKR